MKTGRLAYVAAKQPKTSETVRDICPAGAKDWQPSAFSHKTGLLYIPHNHICFDAEELDVGYIEGTPYAKGRCVAPAELFIHCFDPDGVAKAEAGRKPDLSRLYSPVQELVRAAYVCESVPGM